MKKLIICSILVLFCLNSCYFIEQAILDEKITATQNRGVKKKKEPIIDPDPFDIRDVKNKRIKKVIKIKNMEEIKSNNKENSE